MKYTLLLAAFWLASSFATADVYTTRDFRHVVNTTTGATSVALCGDGGESGIFYHTADYPSCIDGSAFTPGIKMQNGQVWVPMNFISQFYETTCESQWFYCDARPKPPINCTQMKLWQVLSPTLVYLGQADTLGGFITPVEKRTYVCLTSTPTATVSTPTTGVTSTPIPTARASATPVPSSSPVCPGPITQPQGSPTCFCAATNKLVPCPGPVAPGSGTSVTAVPTSTPATPAATRSPSPSRTTVYPVPVGSVISTPTLTPTQSSPTSTVVSSTPTGTTTSTGGGSVFGSVATILVGVGVVIAAFWKKLVLKVQAGYAWVKGKLSGKAAK
jgi:hypothetical protein